MNFRALEHGATEPARRRFNLFGSLRYRDFRFVWSSELLNLWATEMENIVLAWFVLVDTGSPVQVGLIGAARFGGTLLAPIYGTVIDRFDRRLVQIFARAVSASIAIAILALVLTDSLVVWHAYVLVTVGSLTRMLGIVVNQALSADAVPATHLGNAMGLNRATMDLSRLGGSLAGGSLMASLGLGAAYVGVTIVYALSMLAAVAVSKPRRETPAIRVGYFTDLARGVSHVRSKPILVGLIFFTFLTEFTAFPLVNELMAVLGKDVYGVDSDGVGVMRAIASAGSLIGALAVGAVIAIKRPERLLLGTVAAWHIVMLLLTPEPPYPLALLILFVWGLFAGASFVAIMVALLKYTPPEFRGRVMGLRALAVYGLPIGLVFGGWLAEAFGVRQMLLAQSLLGLGLTALAVAAWPAMWRGRVEEARADR